MRFSVRRKNLQNERGSRYSFFITSSSAGSHSGRSSSSPPPLPGEDVWAGTNVVGGPWEEEVIPIPSSRRRHTQPFITRSGWSSAIGDMLLRLSGVGQQCGDHRSNMERMRTQRGRTCRIGSRAGFLPLSCRPVVGGRDMLRHHQTSLFLRSSGSLRTFGDVVDDVLFWFLPCFYLRPRRLGSSWDACGDLWVQSCLFDSVHWVGLCIYLRLRC